MKKNISARQGAFLALQNIYKNKAYTDIAIEKIFKQYPDIKNIEKGLMSELVYGIIRRKRTLNSLINQLATKKANQQPLDLQIILQIGLYQVRYLDKIPPSASVNTSVELAKINNLGKLSGVVNGVLRNYIRLAEIEDPLILPLEIIPKLGVKYSFPDWIVALFLQQLNLKETKKLLQWFNETPTLDLRINPLKTNQENVQKNLSDADIKSQLIPHLPQALRIAQAVGNINNLSGFNDGLFTIQDSSAQLVSHFLNPQPHETIIDACAAPGGKTTHIAELMKDTGIIFACDDTPSRLTKIAENINRLGLKSVQVINLDTSTSSPHPNSKYDRILIDAPCSGLGTLHKRPDIRWHQKPERIQELAELQLKILSNMSQYVKENGILVYATCTLNPLENEEVIEKFLATHTDWHIVKEKNDLSENFPITSKGAIKIFPHRHNMDGFFMIKLAQGVQNESSRQN